MPRSNLVRSLSQSLIEFSPANGVQGLANSLSHMFHLSPREITMELVIKETQHTLNRVNNVDTSSFSLQIEWDFVALELTTAVDNLKDKELGKDEQLDNAAASLLSAYFRLKTMGEKRTITPYHEEHVNRCLERVHRSYRHAQKLQQKLNNQAEPNIIDAESTPDVEQDFSASSNLS